MRTTLGTLLLILVLAGCGSSTAGPETAADTPVESTTTTAAPATTTTAVPTTAAPATTTTAAPTTTTAAPTTTTAAPTTTTAAPAGPFEYAITDEYSIVWVLNNPSYLGDCLSGDDFVQFGYRGEDEYFHCWEWSALPPAPGPPRVPWSLPPAAPDGDGEPALPPLAVANWNFVSLVTAGAGPDSASVVPWVTLDEHIYKLRVGTDGSLVAVHWAECPPELQYASNSCFSVFVYRPDGSPPIEVHENAWLIDVVMVDGDESIVFSGWNQIDEADEWWIAPLRDPVAGARVVAELPETLAVLTWEWRWENDRIAAWGPDEARLTWIEKGFCGPCQIGSSAADTDESLFDIELSVRCRDEPMELIDLGSHLIVDCGRTRVNWVDGDRAVVVALAGDEVEQWRLPITGWVTPVPTAD